MAFQHMINQAIDDVQRPNVSLWTDVHIDRLYKASLPEQAVVDDAAAIPLLTDTVLWDIWPVQLDNGDLADVAGGSLWVSLCAPRENDPDARHSVARMRLIQRMGGRWIDCGMLLPDGFSPGSREWSGSTRFDPETSVVTLWFTAGGRRGEAQADFEQRLFHTVGRLELSGTRPTITKWEGLCETVRNNGALYADLQVNQGVPGRIKGFRDPYWFRDPATNNGYLLFTGSKPAHASQSDYDGVIGLAQEGANGFSLCPPLVDADTLSNELERPHMIVRDGLYYLFWSTQGSVFSPHKRVGPTGLYGMVGPSLFGPFEPLNGSGLVIANPASEPRQAYAWQVLPSLEVVSFIDYWGLKGRDITADPALKAAQFGGTIAPMMKIALQGPKSWIVEGGA